MHYCFNCNKEINLLKDFSDYSFVKGEIYCFHCTPLDNNSDKKRKYEEIDPAPKKQITPNYNYQSDFKKDTSYVPKGTWDTIKHLARELEIFKLLFPFAFVGIFVFCAIFFQ